MKPEVFLTQTLRRHPQGGAVVRVLAAAMEAAEPQAALRRFVSRPGAASLEVAGRVYNLECGGRVFILGLGKAACAMAQPLVALLADRAPRGLLIPKQAPAQPVGGLEIQPGGHPVPDERSLLAGGKALGLVRGLRENDLLICLISGGGSALMSAPPAGVGLSDLRELTALLLGCGARIDEINCLRRRLDMLKGGGLARLAQPAQVVSLILSDVVNSPLEAIASGPSAPDPSTRAEALGILEKYGLRRQVSPAILAALEGLPETPKPGAAVFARVQNVIVGSNMQAAEAAQAQAQAEGFETALLGCDWQGEARVVSDRLCGMLAARSKLGRPFCLVAGGETTVTLRGQGRGGRNQELALAAVRTLATVQEALLVTLATDGEDGPTDAAGAVVSTETLGRGLALGMAPEPFLADNNAYAYFDALGDLIRSGATGTNVNDLMFCFG